MRCLFSLAASIGLLLTTVPVSAQQIYNVNWLFPQSGTWENPLNWSNGMVPNNVYEQGGGVRFNASITDPVTVTTSSNIIVNQLLLNQGALMLGPNYGMQATESLQLVNGATALIQGGLLGSSGPEGGPPASVTSVDGALVHGYGSLGGHGLVRNLSTGKIEADIAGQTLSVVNHPNLIGINAGLMRSVNGGTLSVTGGAINNSGGTIRAEMGSIVDLFSDIHGGTLIAVADPFQPGILNVRGSLDGSASPIHVQGNVTLAGPTGVTLNGAINFDSTVTSSVGHTLAGSTTLGGGGRIAIANTGISGGPGQHPLTIGNLTISGYGGISNVALTNAGIIEADVPSTELIVSTSGSSTNTGTMQAINGGRLVIQGAALDNTGGTIRTNQGTVFLDAAVRGGTLDNEAGGTLNWRNLLDGSSQPVTILGSVSSGNNATLKGTLVVGGNGIPASVALAQGTRLTGDVTFTFLTGDGGSNGNVAGDITGDAASVLRLTNEVRLSGNIGSLGQLTLVNLGRITSNSSIRTAGASVNYGSIISQGSAGSVTLTIASGSFTNWGNFIVENGGSLTVNGAVGNSLVNEGFIVARGVGSTLSVTAPLVVSNTFSRWTALDGGAIYARGLTAFGMSHNDQYVISGNNSLLGIPFNVETLIASLTISGATARFINTNTNTSALNLSEITSFGSLTVLNGPNNNSGFLPPGYFYLNSFFVNLTNSWILRIGDSSQVRAMGNYTQTAGVLDIMDENSSFSVPLGTVSINGGAVMGKGKLIASSITIGAGQITPSVTAIIAPGASPGRFDMIGNLTLGTAANLEIEIGGKVQGTEYDLLAISGSAALGNAVLSIKFYGGFETSISSNDTFTFLTTTNGVTGIFAGLPDGSLVTTEDGLGTFQINYFSNGVVLSGYAAVPEPSAIFAVCGVVAIGLGYWMLRRHSLGNDPEIAR